MRVRKTAQLALEYAGIIALTVVVLVAMFTYLNRSLQGKIESSLVDAFNEEQFAGTARAKGSAFQSESRHMSKTSDAYSFEFGQFMYLGSLSIDKANRHEKVVFQSPKK